ncbi:hypothetical protein Tco_0860328 [Tanacetum coccineum]|uniref:Uncharacterized protein n=1 Tax=Tanacetum coccineum TaxID=301880 RepID=A0ABQ5BF86_9ASTR
MSQLAHLTNSTNSVLVKDMMVKLFEVNNKRDFRIVRESYAMCQALNVRCEERREQMIKMQSFLHVSTVLAESYNLLKELQVYELEKCKELMKSISETQLKVLKKISFIAKLHHRAMSFEFPTDVLSFFKEGALLGIKDSQVSTAG